MRSRLRAIRQAIQEDPESWLRWKTYPYSAYVYKTENGFVARKDLGSGYRYFVRSELRKLGFKAR